ncbi:MAG TPA: hypothetical protein VE569_06980 [Acidimicrobiia bacterium]|jgi:hypothetical protein|nr:hypothetical protein [Acidimicrobiia bacterium]
MNETNPVIGDRALTCFTHGLGHLICELGEEEGIRRAMHILLAISDDEILSDEGIDGMSSTSWGKNARRHLKTFDRKHAPGVLAISTPT